MRRLYDDERRKTSANEKTIGDIYNENKILKNRLKDLER